MEIDFIQQNLIVPFMLYQKLPSIEMAVAMDSFIKI